MKAGFAGDDVPCAVFRSIVGRCKHRCRLRVGCEIKSEYIGEEAVANKLKEELYLNFPIKDGIVVTANRGGDGLWDDIEKLWHHAFYNALRVAPEEHPVLLTEPPGNPKAHRERATQIMFETFSVPAIYLKNQAALSLFAYGSTTGIVLDSGGTGSSVAPIYDGDTVVHATERIKVGGHDLTEYMMRLLSNDGVLLSTMSERDIARDIKEKMSYVSLDFDADTKAFEESSRGSKTYKLPDGRELKLGRAPFCCPEVRGHC